MNESKGKTTKEVCKIVGFTYRQIQELETKTENQKKPLANKPEKNKYGHFLYSEKDR